MDYQRFITDLPDLYNDWGAATVYPKDPQFEQVLTVVKGMTTASILQLLNWAVTCLAPGEAYCEIGCLQGASLIGALLNQAEAIAYGVDDFSEFDPLATNLTQLAENLSQFGIDEQVLFCYQSFADFFAEMATVESRNPIGVYFYDAATDYRSHLMGLLQVRPYLSDQALIVVGNANSDAAQQAIADFCQTHSNCQPLLALPTPGFAHASFWNGIYLLSWDRSRGCVPDQSPGTKREAFVAALKELTPQAELNAIALETYLTQANAYRAAGQEQEAAEVCWHALQHYPDYEPLHMFRITALQNIGKTLEAIAAAQVAAAQFTTPPWEFEQWRTFPILYTSLEEINFYRERFTQGLKHLTQSPLDTPAAQQAAYLGLWWRTNFYLQYQCQDDRPLQTRYGAYAHRVMAAIYPQWAQPLAMPPVQRGKIRIGYVSSWFRHHVVARMTLGWLQQCDRTQFELYAYHTGQQSDAITQQIAEAVDFFHHLSDNLEQVCQQIRRDDLHILVFPEIGMEPLTLQLASLRLAAVQCMGWGHPVTSGLPTVDYFLSSELMEPPNGQAHYVETLIRLPNTGLCYARPEIPPQQRTRAEFGLRAGAIAYLSSQSLFKYLPQYDHLYAEIALQVPQSQFVFIGLNPAVVNQFRQRLNRAFAAVGLNGDDYCIIVPRQTPVGFLQLNQVADVLLDNLGWNGGNTVFDAIACNLPIVTCPGALMRGRHAYGILQAMGMTTTIAKDEREYVAIAVKLGLDPAYRAQIRQKLENHSSAVFDDVTPVRALEAFFRQVAQSP